MELQASSLKLLASQEYNARQIESLIRSQKSARSEYKEIVFVAYFHSKLVGFASLSVYTSTIHAIFVHPDFKRLGIGKRLLETMEHTAIEKEYRTLYVMSSLTAVNFYRAMGYKKTHKSGFWSEGKTWIPCVNMQKQLIPLTPREKWTWRIIFFIICLVVVVRLLRG
ncbi:GNAT family N-acetyltransferase [Coleofasciculus sp. FACHB-64]|nr:GNAT family N-acetyltransferase [Coleofasciculus sp. FACHB-501]MBD2045728.1 GNAT family N-acetyltransferase [Coleofasciculus sp. FACHB-64]